MKKDNDKNKELDKEYNKIEGKNNQKEAEMEKQEKKDKRKKTFKRVATMSTIIIIIILSLRGCGTSKIQNIIEDRGINWDKDGNKKDGILDLDDLQAIKDELQRNTDESLTTYTIAGGIIVDKDGQALLLIENLDINKSLFQIEIIEDKTGTLIYTSPVLEPGTSIKYDKVDKSLPAGTYDATATIYKYSLDGKDLLNYPEIGVKIQFKK